MNIESGLGVLTAPWFLRHRVQEMGSPPAGMLEYWRLVVA